MLNQRRIVAAIKFLLTGLFLWLLWRFVDLGDLADRFKSVHPGFVALSFLVGFVSILLSCAKWHTLMAIHGRRPTFGRSLRIYFIGYYFSALLPSNVGGDAARVVLLSAETGSSTSAASSVFMERVTGLLVLLAFVSVVPLLDPGLLRNPTIWIVSLVTAASLVALLMAVYFRRPVRRILAGLRDLISGSRAGTPLAPAIDWFERFTADAGHAIRALAEKRSIALRVWSISIGFILLTWLNIYVGFRAFGYTPSPGFILVSPTGLFVSSLPVAAVGNLGYTEGVFAHYFSLVGIAIELTIAMATLSRIKFWFFGLIGMFFFVFSEQAGTLRQARKS